jgi:hypothetical protein
MGDIRVETLPFMESERLRWRTGHDEMLLNSEASPFLKRVLARKHAVRPKKFFGEAFVASHWPHHDGYYSSAKWLTSKRWTGSDALDAEDAAELKKALARHFPKLEQFQATVAAFADAHQGVKPVAPDLWLIVNGQHQFIEVKLAKDELAEHQFAGLALIARCLPSEAPVSVILVNLDNTAAQFAKYADQLPL